MNGWFDTVPSPWRIAGKEPETPVLLAYSGGADSSCLLRFLNERSQKEGFSVTLFHLNHSIRGEEADRDAEFCTREAKKYGLELILEKRDIPAQAEKDGTGLEECARQVRYECLERVMRERNIPILVTAHHADDQMETVLFRLCRGSGLRGLCGILPARPFGEGVLVRPFLGVTKQEILTCCREKEIPYVEDSTNSDPAYARNRIRMDVIPALETVFPKAQKRVSKTVLSLAEDREYLDGEAEKALKAIDTESGIPIRELRILHPSVGKRVLEQKIRQYTAESPESVHLEKLWELVKKGIGGSAATLPGGLRGVIRRGRLTVEKDSWREDRGTEKEKN